MSTFDDSMEANCRSAIVGRLGKWPVTNAAATSTALVYLHERGELNRVVNAALPAVKQMLQSSPEQRLDPSRVDDALLRVFRAEGMSMLASGQDSPAFKVLHERQLEEAMSKRVIDQAIKIAVDNGPRGTWPGEILVKATRQLCKESTEPGAEEITAYRIDRALEDTVINGNHGSFYWGSDSKRHLVLNPEGWGEKKGSPPTKIGSAIGDLTGVYGADSR